MEIIAHSLWAAAAGIAAKKLSSLRVNLVWAVWWSTFPDVLAFGPGLAAGLWLRLTGVGGPAGDHLLPRVHIGLPLYSTGHSLIVFLMVFGIVSVFARRPVFELFGWLLHILIDIPTHSFRYYATQFLWPISDLRVDGIAWWTPQLWVATYVVLAVVYFQLWRKGWLVVGRQPSPPH